MKKMFLILGLTMTLGLTSVSYAKPMSHHNHHGHHVSYSKHYSHHHFRQPNKVVHVYNDNRYHHSHRNGSVVGGLLTGAIVGGLIGAIID